MTIIRDGFQSADLDVPVVLPTLNLDFANSQSLDERITFSRGSIGTFVNKNGLIETAPANTPRFDYDPISGECRGLLIEESRQNLLTYSEDFSTSWSRNNYNISTNAITAPDGTLTADKLITINASPTHDLFKTPSLSSDTYTLSIFAKAAEQNLMRLRIDDGVIGRNVIFNLTTGTVSSSNNVTSSSIIQYPNGWYRCSITVTTNIINVVFNTPYPWSGDGTSGIYIWGAQLETGAFPTSYIPTTASTVTRSADNASMIGSNFTSVFDSGTPSELSVFYSGLAPYASINGAYYWVLTNASTTERIQYRYAGQPQVIIVLNGSNYGGVFPNASQDRNIRSVGLIDNKSVAIRTNDGPPSLSFANLNIPRIPTGFQQLNIGSSHAGFNYLNGTIRKLAIYQKRLSSSQAVYLVQ